MNKNNFSTENEAEHEIENIKDFKLSSFEDVLDLALDYDLEYAEYDYIYESEALKYVNSEIHKYNHYYLHSIQKTKREKEKEEKTKRDLEEKIKRDINYHLSFNKIDYKTKELPSFLKKEKEKNDLFFNQFMQLFHSLLFNEKKSRFYLNRMKTKDLQKEVTDLITSNKIDVIPMLYKNGYQLTQNQIVLVSKDIEEKLRKERYSEIEYLLDNMNMPNAIMNSIFFNSTFQILGFTNSNYNKFLKISDSVVNYYSKIENKNNLLQDLVKLMKNIKNIGYINVGYSIVNPLILLYKDYVKFFEKDDFLDFTKEVIKFRDDYKSDVMKKNYSLSHDDNLLKLNDLISVLIKDGNLSKDFMVFDKEKAEEIIEKLKNLSTENNINKGGKKEKYNSLKDTISSNKINISNPLSEDNNQVIFDVTSLNLPQSLKDKLTSIEKNYIYIVENKQKITHDKYNDINLLIKELLQDMLVKYQDLNKLGKKSLKNVEGKPLNELMKESIFHIEYNLEKIIEEIDEKKIREISIKNRQIKSYRY